MSAARPTKFGPPQHHARVIEEAAGGGSQAAQNVRFGSIVLQKYFHNQNEQY